MTVSASPPDVSIILPVYKAAGTIRQCIDSLFQQTLAPDRYEILAILNGPDDGSRALLAEAQKSHPQHRLRILESPVASAGAARNVGLDHVAGRNVTFVDADDWISNNYLAELVDAADGFAVPAAGLVDVAADGSINEDTAVMRSLSTDHEDGFAVFRSLPVSAMSACKLLPAEWLRHHRFDADLRSGEDVVFYGTLFSSFERTFTEYNRAPFANGARYYRRLSEASVSRAQQSFDFSVLQRLEVIKRITRGLQEDPQDRSRLINAMVAGQSSMIQSYLTAHPDERPKVIRALADSGVRGVSLTSTLGGAWPTHGVTTGRAKWFPVRRLLLLSGSTAPINRVARQVQFLRNNGLTVRLGYFRGRLNESLGKASQHRFAVVREADPIDAPPPANWVGEARRRLREAKRLAMRVGRRAAPHLMPGRLAVRIAARTDPAGRRLLEKDAIVIPLDSGGESLASGNLNPEHDLAYFHALVLSMAAQFPATGSQAAAIGRSADWLGNLPDGHPLRPPAHVWAMAIWRLMRSQRYKQARGLLKIAHKLHASSWEDEGLAMLELLAELQDLDALPAAAIPLSTKTVASADRALEEGDIDKATFLLMVVCEVLFAQDFNTNVPDPPILHDPQRLLSGIAASKTWRLLTTDSAPSPTLTDANAHVLVLPGAYPKFAGGVLEALAGHAEVRELRLGEKDPEYQTIGVSPATLRLRLQHGTKAGLDEAYETAHSIQAHDVIFADWADKGAVLTSLLVPPGKRFIVRFHGVDSLTLWQFLVDWGRVSDVVFVSEHLKRSVERVLGDRLAHVRKHVVGNTLDVERFAGANTGTAPRTLGLVGWGQRVKDPLWAVEVLAELRRQDPSWRLLLIGKDFGQTSRRSEKQYAATFRQRVLEDDVVGAIDYVGFTSDLPRHLARIGFAISSSLRESFHIGVLEMAASGAVPVIRNWPVYRDLGGAAELFPSQWVVATPQEAAERILAHAETETWRATADEAREVVARRFGGTAVADSYRRIILG